MSAEPSLWSFIADSGPLVKSVLCILLCASIASWAIIIQKWLIFKKYTSAMESFEKTFWSGTDLNKLYQQFTQQQPNTGLAQIFCAGFKEFHRWMDHPKLSHSDGILEAVRRAMQVAEAHQIFKLEQHLSFLATVGSVSPYVGLFGTVWGIMTSFRSLGAVQQASIAMVAPGISEALIATAVGLFAAIPAVIAYNRFNYRLEHHQQQMAIFQEELVAILQRSLYSRDSHAVAI
ncbi:MAG: protein TolQ [Proteobacteria bacterium]|nr:protein TolQ [Pseudomonadota bacterium]